MAAALSELHAHRLTGRPLRFLVAVLCLWVSARIVVAHPFLLGDLVVGAQEAQLAAVAPARVAPYRVGAANIAPTKAATAVYYGRIAHPLSLRGGERIDRLPIIMVHRRGQRSDDSSLAADDAAIEATAGGAVAMGVPAVSISVPLDRRISTPAVSPLGMSDQRAHDLWSGSAWAFWRRGNARAALGSVGQLGGAQAGVRIERRLADLGGMLPVIAYARLTSALEKPAMPEAALGLAVHPISGRVPLTVGIERRFALDRDGRNAFALVAVSGLNPTKLAPFLIAEGYVQAGVVGFSHRDAFVDGRLSLAAPIGPSERARAGFSLSGGAQPGLSRLDVGPLFEMRLPLGHITPRLMVEWRQRVAGNAQPGSGLSVTLATGF